MLHSEDQMDKGLFPYELKSLDGMIHSDHLATPQKRTGSSVVSDGASCKLNSLPLSQY